MAYITHFQTPEGEQLRIAAATQFKVVIPAATAEDLQGWFLDHGVYVRKLIRDWFTEDMVVQVSCDNADVFTEHGLTVTLDNTLIELELTSLPTDETVLYLLVHHAVEGGAI